MFKSKKKMMYPKNTSELIAKFNLGTKRESGIGVWAMYKNQQYDSIESRNYTEVRDFLQIYDQLLENIRLSNISPKYHDPARKKRTCS